MVNIFYIQSLIMGLDKYIALKPEEDKYRDRKFVGTEEDYAKALQESTIVYVGRLPEEMSEEAIWFMFSTCGEIKRVIMGINRTTLYPCGFCFVEFYNKESARIACLFDKFVYGGNEISVNIDYGFVNGRQFGRGYFGGSFKNDKELKRKQYGRRYHNNRNQINNS
ncbi:hypothetical protein H311_03688 [Anncaliia algerae PRA109]|nr:hypothetical protein H311_03688 [Anncaliia algerae PRA109]